MLIRDIDAIALAGPGAIDIDENSRAAIVAQVTDMHMRYYGRTAGFGQAFEAVVSQGLADFVGRLERPSNAIWIARRGHAILGAVAIDGEDLGGARAHLRWFIVDDAARGSGLGRRLLQAAMDFVDAYGFSETQLWTFSGLNAARHLYEAVGFRRVEERPGTQWGLEVLEQRFVRPRQASAAGSLSQG